MSIYGHTIGLLYSHTFQHMFEGRRDAIATDGIEMMSEINRSGFFVSIDCDWGIHVEYVDDGCIPQPGFFTLYQSCI
jgi:hypothetical protein